MRYRRARVDGGAYFFTVNLAERHRSLLVEYIDVLRKVVGMVKERHPFTIDAMVFYLNICMRCGPCRQGTRTTPGGGYSSKRDSHGISPKGNDGALAGRAKESAASGNAVIGNISSETKKTLPDMWITSILIQ